VWRRNQIEVTRRTEGDRSKCHSREQKKERGNRMGEVGRVIGRWGGGLGRKDKPALGAFEEESS